MLAAPIVQARNGYTVAGIAGLSLLGLLAGGLAIRAFAPLEDWVYTHWLFNYEFGLVKRGLAGQLLSALGVSTDYQTVGVISIAISTVLSALLLGLFSVDFIRRPSMAAWLFAAFWLAHPGTLQHAYFDVGRFDTIGVLLMLLAALFIRTSTKYQALFAVLLIGIFQVLFHEANFLMFMPLMLAMWLFKQRSSLMRSDVIAACVVLGVVIGFVCFMDTKTLSGRVGLDAYYAHLLSISDHAHPYSVYVLFKAVDSNLQSGLGRLISLYNAANVVYMGMALFLSFVLIARMLRVILFGGSSFLSILLVLSALSPLALSFIGFDYYRWWSVALMNLGVVVVFLAHEQGQVSELMAVVMQNRYWVVACLLLDLIVGPLGVMDSFQSFIPLWNFILSACGLAPYVP
ncbi:hypothetical protein [Pseudomonas sp. LRF_L74]|uniref:hypothetical protein n=1 Tax=Pseudomonas sp. LRF_L74 TaxID=3369422 RepID=UPI003F629930